MRRSNPNFAGCGRCIRNGPAAISLAATEGKFPRHFSEQGDRHNGWSCGSGTAKAEDGGGFSYDRIRYERGRGGLRIALALSEAEANRLLTNGPDARPTWPQCGAILNSGSKSSAQCPYFEENPERSYGRQNKRRPGTRADTTNIGISPAAAWTHGLTDRRKLGVVGPEKVSGASGQLVCGLRR